MLKIRFIFEYILTFDAEEIPRNPEVAMVTMGKSHGKAQVCTPD